MGIGEKIATGIGVTAGLITIASLLSHYVKAAKALPAGIPVSLKSEPVRVEFLVDGKPVESPTKIRVAEGYHVFEASKIGLDLTEQYDFYAWEVNGQVVSHEPALKIYVAKPMELKAVYILSESYPAVIPFT